MTAPIEFDAYGFATGDSCPSSTASVTIDPLNDETTTNAGGNIFYLRGGTGTPEVPTPGWTGGDWHFGSMGAGGSPDFAGDCGGNYLRIVVVGDGTLAIETATYMGSPRGLTATLWHQHVGDVGPTSDDIQTGDTGDTLTFTVSSHGQTECTHWVDLHDDGAACGGKWGFAGATWTLSDGADAGELEFLGTFDDAYDKVIRMERNGTGSGSFKINRNASGAFLLPLTKYIKVRVPSVDADPIFGIWPEEGDVRVVSEKEQGGEVVVVDGPGPLYYLDFAILWPQPFVIPGPIDTTPEVELYLAGTGTKPGQLFKRQCEEWQHGSSPQDAVPLLTHASFDYDDDSDGNTWTSTDATDQMTTRRGISGLALTGLFIGTGVFDVEMQPDLEVKAWNGPHGRDLTGDFGAGVVRFERGVNIASELDRNTKVGLPATHELVIGDGEYGYAELADAADRVRRWTSIDSYGDDATTLEALGLADLNARLAAGESVVVTPWLGTDEGAGRYLPGPDWTDNGNYWLGDVVTVHTGDTTQDYDEVDLRVHAITITESEAAEANATLDDPGLVVAVELTSAWRDRETRATGTRGSYGGGISAPTGGGSTTLPSRHGHKAAGVSYDNTVSGLTADDVQEAIDELAATGGLSDLDDLTDVVITSATAGQRLRFNGTSWVNVFTRDEPHVDSVGSVVVDSTGNPVMLEVVT